MTRDSDQPLPRVRRKLGPAIAWAPTHDPSYLVARVLRTTRTLPPLYVTQAAYLQVEATVRESSTTPSSFGLLTGALCVCPESGIEYFLIDGATRARTHLGADDSDAVITAELHSLVAETEGRGNLAIGWYMVGVESDLRLAPQRIQLHRQLFPEPWQVFLLRDTAPDVDSHGAFIRVEPSSDLPYAMPFFELLPDTAERDTEPARSAVRWGNYRTTDSSPQVQESEAGERPPARTGTLPQAQVTPSHVSGGRPDVPREVGRVEAYAHPPATPALHAAAAAGGGSAVVPAQPAPAPQRVAFPVLVPEDSGEERPNEPSGRGRRVVALLAAILLVLAAAGAYLVTRS